MKYGYCVCVVCSNEFVGRAAALYCSDACRQKAYRSRRKQVENSRQQTMTMDEYQHFQFVIDRCPDSRHEIEELMLISRRDRWHDLLLNISSIVRDARRKHAPIGND